MAASSGESDKDFNRWALLERVQAAGLLSRAGGSTWSMLSEARGSGLIDQMIESRELIEVTVEGSPRHYLALPGFLERGPVRYDGRARILGPLDPLLWDRQLVRTAFEFDYVWEVYKPEQLRKWGWYVCPILHRDELVGRIDARIVEGLLIVKKVWLERAVDPELVVAAIHRHAERCKCEGVKMREIRKV